MSSLKLLVLAALFAATLATDCVAQACRCKTGSVAVTTKDANGCDTCYCAASSATTVATTAAPATTRAATTTVAPVTTSAPTTAKATTKAATTTLAPVNLCPNIPALSTCACKPDAVPYYATNANGCLYCGCKAVPTTVAPTTTARTTTVATTTKAASTAAVTTTRAATAVVTTTIAPKCETPTPCYCNPTKAQLVWQADSEGCPFCFCQALGSALGVTPATAPDSGSSGVPTAVPIVAAFVGAGVVIAAVAAVYRYRVINGRMPWSKAAAPDTTITSDV
eukprot:m.260949 g.260949  ORF g.260949 m.260949 type:complete len:280 (+) comp24138_c0_seq1:192-1031(+)